MKQCLKTIKLVATILVLAKANETRLNNLILLIPISYTISSFQVQKVKNKGVKEYISRTNKKGKKERRHSSFFCIPHSALQVYYKGIFNEEGRLQPLLLLITINSFCNMYFYLQTS